MQVKLLRVLETRSFFRLGGVAPIKVDVRVVAATNRPLKDRVARGEFRDDLFYRLNVLSIYLPPLRERREDIPLLVKRFVRELAAKHDRPFPGIAVAAMQRLMQAPWPGNVRQLHNLVESMVVLAPRTEIQAADIPPDVMDGVGTLLPMRISGPRRHGPDAGRAGIRVRPAEPGRAARSNGGLAPAPGGSGSSGVEVIEVTDPAASHVVDAMGPIPVLPEPEPEPVVVYRPGMKMAEVERATIETVLKELSGNRRKAAQVLGIGERTLYRKLKEFDIA